jgi:hypothetical protein
MSKKEKKVFEKIKVGGFFFFLYQQPTLIFSKTFFLQNMRINNTNLTQKAD